MRNETQLLFASIPEIAGLFRKRKLSPLELTRLLLERIATLNPRLNAFLTVNEQLALQQARRAESALCAKSREKSRHDRGPLHGIPISLKDNIYTAGMRTTAGSWILQNFIPSQDAPVVTALKNAGAVILGKTNMHEFAYGVTTDNPHFGPARNPWDLQRIPGGSSGGSAAALAAGLGYGSIGTDTGGSIRIPASLCGVVGLKPGPGRVSAEGVIPLSPTLDVVGPLARTVEDTALLFEAISLREEGPRRVRSRRSPSARGWRPRLGIPKEFFLAVLSPDVAGVFQAALTLLQKQGVRVKEVILPLVQETEDAGNQIAWPEATQYHRQQGWYPCRSDEYGEDVRSRLEMGMKVSAVSYLEALEQRKKFIQSFNAALTGNQLDGFVVPTTPIAAARIGEETFSLGGKDYSTRALLLRLNRPANLAGVPAVSVPCGLSAGGLPIGLQFIGPMNSEALLLDLARAFVQSCPLNARPLLS